MRMETIGRSGLCLHFIIEALDQLSPQYQYIIFIPQPPSPASRLGLGLFFDDSLLVLKGLSFIDRNSIRGRTCGETIDREIDLLTQSQLNAVSHFNPLAGKRSCNEVVMTQKVKIQLSGFNPLAGKRSGNTILPLSVRKKL